MWQDYVPLNAEMIDFFTERQQPSATASLGVT